MNFPLTLALFVFAGSLANASLNYSDAELDLTVPLSDSTVSPGDFFPVTSPPDVLQPDGIESPDTNLMKYTFEQDPDVPFAASCAWIELFHQR